LLESRPAAILPKHYIGTEAGASRLLAFHGEQARRATGLERIHTVPAKHFLQEDQAPAIVERVANLARSATAG